MFRVRYSFEVGSLWLPFPVAKIPTKLFFGRDFLSPLDHLEHNLSEPTNSRSLSQSIPEICMLAQPREHHLEHMPSNA